MRQPARHDITIVQGDDFDMVTRLREPPQEEGGPPGPYIDLTGYQAWAQIRAERKKDADLLAQFEVTVMEGTAAGEIGTIVLYVPWTVTATLPVGKEAGWYDLETRSSQPRHETWIHGRVEVVPEVTIPPVEE